MGVAIVERSKSGALSAFRRSDACRKLDNTGEEMANGMSLLEIEPDVEDVGDAKECRLKLDCGEKDVIEALAPDRGEEKGWNSICTPLDLSLVPIPTIFELSSFLTPRSKGTTGSDSCISE